MNKKFLIIGLFILAILILATVYLWLFQKPNPVEVSPTPEPPVSNFEDCVAADYPVMESYPRKCSANGQTFTEDIGNEIEKQDFIRLESPRPNDKVESPLKINGQAQGAWFFEASFPVKIYGDEGKLLGTAIASTTENWMSEDFVSFTATLEFEKPASKKGRLILEKDNPSGLPENDDQLEIPVIF